MTIHPSAVIDPKAELGSGVRVGPHVVIEAGASIGDDCEFMAGAVVHGSVSMGAGNIVHPHAVLGGDPQVVGFDRSTPTKTVIGDGNLFREFSTVHRAMYADAATRIGDNCCFMVTAHVAHDCSIGDRVIIANGSSLSGHCLVEDQAFISGNVCVHQFTRIGKLAMLGGLTGVGQDVPPYMMVRGDIAFYVGLNVVGLRRAGVGGETRKALRHCYRELFHSGRILSKSVDKLREEFGADAPAEVAHLLDFCGTKSKRGITLNTSATGRRDAEGGAESSG